MEYLTLKEVAAALGVSADTVRRRIKSGQLKAEKVEGVHGLQWMIKADDLTASAEIVEVIPVKTELNPAALVALIREAVKEEQKEQREEVQRLRDEISRLNELLEGLNHTLPAKEKEAQEEPEKRWWQVWK